MSLPRWARFLLVRDPMLIARSLDIALRTIFARDVMTQRPIGEVVLRTERGEEVVPLEPENLYARTIQAFAAAIRGEGQPSCTGEEGMRSLATALAALESARTGRRVAVQLG